jgi:tRNA G10  N-methylase Trm11
VTENKENYTFILGTNPALSLAEILSVFGREGLIQDSPEIVLMKIPGLSPNSLKNLGGTIKLGRVFETLPLHNLDASNVVQLIGDMIQRDWPEGEKKIHFGISVYNLNASSSMYRRFSRAHNFIYINLKKSLAKSGFKLAYIRTKEVSLSSASVIKNRLNSRDGLEVQLILGKEKIFLAQTIAVQDINLYTQMDIGRPRRDLVSGTTPPKLAKAMINLANPLNKNRFFDPFCGSGTFLQEAALLGYTEIFGSDISEKAVLDSQQNIEWLKGKDINLKSKFEVSLFDATELSRKYKSEYFDAIVSEGY